MYEDLTFKIINVGDNRINRLNHRFARYLLAGGTSKSFLISFINAALLFDGDNQRGGRTNGKGHGGRRRSGDGERN